MRLEIRDQQEEPEQLELWVREKPNYPHSFKFNCSRERVGGQPIRFKVHAIFSHHYIILRKTNYHIFSFDAIFDCLFKTRYERRLRCNLISDTVTPVTLCSNVLVWKKTNSSPIRAACVCIICGTAPSETDAKLEGFVWRDHESLMKLQLHSDVAKKIEASSTRRSSSLWILLFNFFLAR